MKFERKEAGKRRSHSRVRYGRPREAEDTYSKRVAFVELSGIGRPGPWAVVDVKDWERVCAEVSPVWSLNGGYPSANIRTEDGKWTTVKLARAVMQPQADQSVLYAGDSPLDCRRQSLEVVTGGHRHESSFEFQRLGTELLCYIELTQGKFAIVDKADAERVRIASKTWHFHADSGTARSGNGTILLLLLHRFIADAKPGQIVRAINGDYLDCRRSNLKAVDDPQAYLAASHGRGRKFIPEAEHVTA